MIQAEQPVQPTGPKLIERLAEPLDDMLRVLFHDAASGLLIVDRAGRVVRANEALRQMLGHGTEILPGHPVMALFPDEERDRVWSALAPALAGERPPDRFATRLQVPAGALAVDVSGVALRESDGVVSGLVLRLSDITVQTRLEAQLAHGGRLQAMGQLAGGIAHDFNNLLTAVIGAADMVLGRPGMDAVTLEDVGEIRRAAERGADLVRQLLAFGRQQASQPSVVDVGGAIRDISSMLRRLLGGKVRLALQIDAVEPNVWMDPTQLDQVLVNLAVNARNAMPEGGVLTLRCMTQTIALPRMEGAVTLPAGDYVVIEVADTGTGIAPDVLPLIFDPFFTTRQEHGGTGLGLSTVHGAVRQAGGCVGVESRVGEGTCFRIQLPRYTGKPEHVRGAATMALDAAGRVAVLVEDEPPVRRLAQRMLSQQGWRVLAAESAEAALELIAAEPALVPALVISDVALPGADGPALIRRLRARWPDLPAILVSGYVEEGLRREMEQEGVLFVAKPYKLTELVAQANRVAGRAATSPLTAA